MSQTQKEPLSCELSVGKPGKNKSKKKNGLIRRFLDWLARGSEKSAAVHSSCRS